MTAHLWLLVLLATPPEEAEPPSARVAVAVTSDTGERWTAAALEQTLLHDLAGFSRVFPVNTRVRTCSGGDIECLLASYSDAGVDIIVIGTLRGKRFSYEVYETWIGSRVSRGSWEMRGLTLLDLRQRILAALRPFMESGGLIDRKPFLVDRGRGVSALSSGSTEGWALVLFAVAMLLGLPLLVGRLGRGRQNTRRGKTRVASAAGMLGALVGGALAAYQPKAMPDAIGRLEAISPLALEQLVVVAGGVAWGGLSLLLLRLVFPPVPGIGQVRHGNINLFLSTWLAAAGMRAVLLMVSVGVPSALLTWVAGLLLELDSFHTLILVAPAVGLLVHYLWLASADELASAVDTCAVLGDASRDNPWHGIIKRYLSGYLRRLGLDADWRLLDRVLFLPGRCQGVITYGGGLTPPRIVIDIELLELALGPVQEEQDEHAPAAPVEAGAWSLGLMTAHEDEPPRRWWRRVARLRAAGRKRPPVARRRRRVKPALIGENATLLGAVMPLPPSETVPLIANDDQDFGVVRELLTEHYAAFEKGWFEGGYDDSDPTWKDFLFGPLSRELGALVRGDGIMKTFLLTWEIWLTRLPWLVRSSGEMLRAGYLRFLSHYVAALPDAHAALNSARDHLVQYLCLQRDGCADDLTAHADASALLYTSHRLLARTAESEPSQQLFQTTVRKRLLRLSRYLNSPYLEARKSRLGWAAVVLVLAGLATAAGVAVQGALDYHPTFVERMHQAEMESADHGKRERL